MRRQVQIALDTSVAGLVLTHAPNRRETAATMQDCR
jgi:hypothetical protein